MGAPNNDDGLKNPALEAYNIIRLTWLKFYNPSEGQFVAKESCAGCYGDKGRFCVWPLSVYAQAVVDGAKFFPKELGPMIDPTFAAVGKYLHGDGPGQRFHGAYPASEYFNGNDDIYYDDTAQVCSALIGAYEVTRHESYLKAAHDTVNFLMTGYTEGDDPGGVRWHVAKEGANTCTTSECACAALRLATHLRPEERVQYIQFAENCVSWVLRNLQDEDGLICDGRGKDENNVYTVNYTKWSYNQGNTLSALTYLYVITGKDRWLQEAQRLADVTTDRNTAIFDRDCGMDTRYYRDNTYFYQLLAEGLTEFVLLIGNKADPRVVRQVKTELKRHLDYIYTYLRDTDNLYFQKLEIFRIDEKRYKMFKDLTGENKDYSPDNEERQGGPKYDNVPAGKRPLTKTLIGQGSAARIFLQGAKIWDTLNSVN